MSDTSPTLHMLCGKIAAGKTTLASKLTHSHKTVLIAEDAWLKALFGAEMVTPADYVEYTSRLRGIMGPHISTVLASGVSVVLDFQANTVKSRLWMRNIFETAHASHQLHLLTPSDAICLERLHKRNAQGEHPFQVTDTQFYHFSKYFELPTDDEGFDIVRYS